jgi:hypothetical protein
MDRKFEDELMTCTILSINKTVLSNKVVVNVTGNSAAIQLPLRRTLQLSVQY